jgi:hypothetical protein
MWALGVLGGEVMVASGRGGGCVGGMVVSLVEVAC